MTPNFFLWPLFLLVFCSTRLTGTTYGADQTTIQGQLSISGGDNRIANTAYIDNGFNLTDNTTTCTFDSFQSCLGIVNLNRGKLYLTRNMFLNNFFSWGIGGQIYGQGHAVSFPETSSVQFPNSQATKTLGTGPISTRTMGANISAISWSYDDKYVAAGASGTTNNVAIYPFSNNALGTGTTFSTTTAANVNTVAWSPTANYLAIGIASTVWSLTVGRWNGTALIFNPSTDRINLPTAAQAIAWSPDGKYLAVTNNTGMVAGVIIYSYSGPGTLSVAVGAFNYSNGISATPVTYDAISWDSSGKILCIGFNSGTTGYISLLNFNGSSLSQFSGSPYSLGTAAVASARYKPASPNIVSTGLSSSTTRFRMYNPYLGALTQRWANTESINYNTHCWSVDGNYVATGLSTGGTTLRIYYLPGNNSSLSSTTAAYKLSLISALTTASNVLALDWTRTSNNYIAAGYGTTVGLFQIVQLSEYRKTNYIDTTNISLNSDMELIGTTTFYGNCTINGNGNTLNLSNGTGKITVASGGKLSLQNLNLIGLKGQNLNCLSNSSSINFENCTLTVTSDFNFSTGSILFNQDNTIIGTNKFIYSSVVGSTINSNSSLYLSNGLTFSYAPAGAYKNLIYMPDNSSYLFLDGCTLHLTKTGLNLINGRIFLDNNVTIETESIKSKSNALTFGNGNSKNDLDINILSECKININGRLEYLNSN